ncbi:MAG: Rpn family recombination-promoting nuclease/putative transposase [Turicibacter sp.]|nr:Rpn family recombination-promoting nuclease/putative transposase [Turicibacter sp.]
MAKRQGTKLIYTFKSDVLFKMLFTKNPDLLKRLVAVLLNIPLASIEEFYQTNTEMPPEEVGSKFCRLDINMVVNGKKVNIEIQVADEGNYLERTMFNWAKLFTTSLPSGDDYAKLPKTICISILGFVQFDCAAVHSEFAPMEITRHEILSDKQRYHFFELPKLPDVDKIDFGDERELWLALFNAETEEELEKLTKGGEVMEQAIQAYRGTAADEEFRYLERLREKRRHDEAQALRNARAIERKKWQGVVAEKDAAWQGVVAEKDAAWQGVVAEKDAAWQGVVAEKDAAWQGVVAEKDALIADLQARLNKS